MTSITDPENALTTFTYDVMGNVLTKTDARGKIWTSTYYPSGDLKTITTPLSHTTSFEYDGVGNKTRETNAEGKIRTYEYNSDNRMTKATDALGNVTLFTYNPDGKLIRQTDPEGRIITCQVFLKLDKSAIFCASSLVPHKQGLIFFYAVEIGKEISLFSIPTATVTT